MYTIDNEIVFPTLDFVKQETGHDIFYEAGSETKAKAIIKKLTKLAYRVLMKEKILQVQTVLKDKILNDEKYRREFLEFVLSVIDDVYTKGTFEFLENGTDDILTPKSRSYLEQGLLAVGRF